MLHISHDQRVLGTTGRIAPAGLRLKFLPIAVALCFCPAIWAGINDTIAGLPMGGTVAAGSVSGGVSGNQLALTQTGSRAVIDWQSFNINAGKTVQFVQDSPTAAVLNRVPASAGLSEIYGTLTANGMVLLMNPNGVLFGAGSSINVGSLIATTGTVNQADFVAGGNFGITGVGSGSVSNRGTISGAGLVAMVAPSVSNQGSIIATGGRIALSGADRATVSLNGGLYEFAVPSGALGTNATVTNAAAARLEGASLLMSTGDAANLVSGVINLHGVQQASSAIVVNGNTVVLTADLNAPAISGSSNSIQVQAGASIQDAVKIAKTGTPGAGATVDVQAGTYAEQVTPNKEQVTLNKANLTLSGHDGAKLLVPDLAEVNGVLISANNVTVQGLEIAGPINAPYNVYYRTEPGYVTPTGISRGIVVSKDITGFTLRDNSIHDVRTGVLINGINNTGSVSANTIENTKSGISVQYTDAAGVTIANNREGATGNEWGLNLHLNGHLVGSTIVNNSTPIAAAPTSSWQQSLLNLSTSNNGWAVQDQGYTAFNRTHANVATSGAATNQGSRLTPINTIPGGINAVVAGGRVNVAAGTYLQPSTLIVNKSVTLAGAGEAATIIDARGITGNYGMNVSADNVTLRDFTFYGPTAFFASAYGIKVSPGGSPDARLRNFSIMNVTSRGAGKAELDLNGVDGALIDHVTLNGAPVGNDAGTTQGAGLQLTDSANVTVRNTSTLNNAWGSVALYQSNRSYNQQVNNISIEGNNRFLEVNPVYLQDESALRDFGTLNIAGFGYAVRNAASTDSGQYTWLQATPQKAYDFAVNLPGTTSSYIQGWSGAAATQNYEVGIGNLAGGGTQAMSIANALNQSASGASINVGAGSYNENVSLSSRRNLNFADATLQGLVLNAGAADSGIGGRVTVSGATGITFNAPVNLLANTVLATNGANITLNGHVQNANGVQYALTLTAGSGSNRGDVSMTTGGSESNPLNQFEVTSNRFNLSDTLWVQRYRINATGDVALSHHTLRAMDAGGANTLTTAGNVTGATTSKGSVEVVSSGDVSANVAADGQASVAANNITGNISGSDVAVAAQGKVDVVVTATNSASLSGGTIVGTVSAPTAAVDSGGGVQLELHTKAVTVHADGGVSLTGGTESIRLDAPSGSVSGNFGTVTNVGDGLFKVNGKPKPSQTVADNAENNRVIPVRYSILNNVVPETKIRVVPTQVVALTGQSGRTQSTRSTPLRAGDAVDRGQSVEIDLSPGNAKEQK